MHIYLSAYILIGILVQVICQKTIFMNETGYLTLSKSNKSYFWIFNTSCSECLIRFDLLFISLSNTSVILFGKSPDFSSVDITIKNFNRDKYAFGYTNKEGLYFAYYFASWKDVKNYVKIAFKITTCTYNTPQCLSKIDTKNQTTSDVSNGYDEYFGTRIFQASCQVEGDLYVHGGLSLTKLKHNFIRFSNGKWFPVIQSDPIILQPPCLWGHSMTYSSTERFIVIFGGVLCNDNAILIDNFNYPVCLWIYYLDTMRWNYVNCNKVHLTPVVGHAIAVYDGILYIFFGITKHWTFVDTIQRFNLTSMQPLQSYKDYSDTKQFGLVFFCFVLNGHEAFIHGGIIGDNSFYTRANNVVWKFNFRNLILSTLSDNGPFLYLHQCSLLNMSMVMIGGVQPVHFTFVKSEKFFQMNSDLVIYQSIKPVFKSWHISTQSNLSFFYGYSVYQIPNTQLTLELFGGKNSGFLQYPLRIYPNQQTWRTYQPNKINFKLMKSTERTVNCRQWSTCSKCVTKSCAWCSAINRCVNHLQLILLRLMGQCDFISAIRFEFQCPIECSSLKYCTSCTNLPFCVWCEYRVVTKYNRTLTGSGKCLSISDYPKLLVNNDQLAVVCKPLSSLHLINSTCKCGCNGHGDCSENSTSDDKIGAKQICQNCIHNTRGDHCERCKRGFKGHAESSKKCTRCDCVRKGLAGDCLPDGSCEHFCIEKGRVGLYCEKCDSAANFTNFNGKCAFKSTVNFRYVLNQKKDNFNQFTDVINFLLPDLTREVNLHFFIRCLNSPNSLFHVELYNSTNNRSILVHSQKCTQYDSVFPGSLFIGHDSYKMMFVISNFRRDYALSRTVTADDFYEGDLPFQLEIIFKTKVVTSLPYIFISLFACASTALLMVYTLFKIKQLVRRRTARHIPAISVERPVGSLSLVRHTDIMPSSGFQPQHPLVSIEPIPADVDPLFAAEDNNNKCNNNSRGSSSSCNSILVSYLFRSPQTSSATRLFIGCSRLPLPNMDIQRALMDLPTQSTFRHSNHSVIVDRELEMNLSPSNAVAVAAEEEEILNFTET